MGKIQVVLDTNVLVAALRSKRGAASQLVRGLLQGQWQLNVSNPLVLEYEAVLKRSEMSEFISIAEADEFVDALCSVAINHRIFFLWRLMVRDPDDAFVFELAIKANIDYLITFNTNDFPLASEFGVKLVTPREFLEDVGELP
jgi:putative PIN family toxin of toxin-antitoxin system